MPGVDGKVGFAIVGLGIGLTRCEMMQQVPEARLVAVVDLVEPKAREVAERFGADWYTDHRQVLERPDVDVVGVYTPSGLHLDIALEVAAAGKHVLTTKPMEITLDRVDRIITACDAARVKLATEFAERYHPVNYAIYRAIGDGKLGKMVLGEYSFKCYRNQEYYESNGGWRGTWRLDGGGAIMNQTIHSVDQMLWQMGDAESVTARWGTYTHRIETEDTAAALVTFKSGAMGVLIGTTTFHNDRFARLYGGGVVKRIEVNGELGSATSIDGKVAMWKVVGDEPVPSEVDPPAVNVFQDYARWAQDDSYASPTLVKGPESRKTVEFILALYESARTGQTVSLGESS